MVSRLEEVIGKTVVLGGTVAFALNYHSIVDAGSLALSVSSLLAVGITDYAYLCKQGVDDNIDHTLAYLVGTTLSTGASLARTIIGTAGDAVNLALTTGILAYDFGKESGDFVLNKVLSVFDENYGQVKPYGERMAEIWKNPHERYTKMWDDFSHRLVNNSTQNQPGQKRPDGLANELAMWVTTNGANIVYTFRSLFTKEEVEPLHARVRNIPLVNISY